MCTDFRKQLPSLLAVELFVHFCFFIATGCAFRESKGSDGVGLDLALTLLCDPEAGLLTSLRLRFCICKMKRVEVDDFS